VSSRIDYDADVLKLVSITAYRKERYLGAIDGDGGPLAAAQTDIAEQTSQFSQEFQVLSPSQGAVRWVAGAYFFTSDGKYDPGVLSGFAYAPLNSVILANEQKATSEAVFGQLTAKLSDSTNLTIGARYTTERRRFSVRESATFAPDGPVVALDDANAEKTFSQPTWRFALDHSFGDGLLGYVSYNRGFKSGVYNASSSSTTPVKPETIDAYEAGFKSTLFDRRLRINTAAFYSNYKDIQIPEFIDGLSVLQNAAAAKIYGLDADVEALVADGLQLSAGAEVIHARYASFPDAPSSVPLPGGGNAIGSENAAGNYVMLTPSATFFVSSVYKWPISTADIDSDLTYYHNSGWYGEANNVLRQPAYGQLNAKLSWFLKDRGYTISIWGKNLTNSQPAQYLAAVAAGSIVAVSPPRTFGVTFSAKVW
jgi:iron complex outermembrane receptor protein